MFHSKNHKIISAFCFSTAILIVVVPLLVFVSGCTPIGRASLLIGLPGKIAFSSLRDGNWEIYTMNPDGNNQTRLTYDPGVNEVPVWAPDARTIVFQSLRNANFELYLFDTSNGSENRLTNTLEDEKTAHWSPNGDKLVYVVSNRALPLGIETLDLSTGDRSSILSPGCVCPVWSPDGRYIAYSLSADPVPKEQIYRVNSDRTGTIQLTNTGQNMHNINPAWSPDSKKIAFQSLRDGNWQIYTMNADGTQQTRLTFNSFSDENPSWSPDGKWIVFESNRRGVRQIYVMKADGSEQTRVTNDPRGARYPNWSPK